MRAAAGAAHLAERDAVDQRNQAFEQRPRLAVIGLPAMRA